MEKIIRIYVAGPYSIGNREENVKEALTIGSQLLDLGFFPYVPHLTHFWHTLYPRPKEDWMDLDFTFLEVCQGLFRIKGISVGADIEENIARRNNIPIFYEIPELVVYKFD
jgi:hypothetical protein